MPCDMGVEIGAARFVLRGSPLRLTTMVVSTLDQHRGQDVEQDEPRPGQFQIMIPNPLATVDSILASRRCQNGLYLGAKRGTLSSDIIGTTLT